MKIEMSEKPKRARGTGSIYPRGNTLWAQYHRNGKVFRESTHETDPRKAERFLQRRLGEVAAGNFLGPQVERVKVTELADDLQRDYRINGHRSLDSAEARWRLHLEPFFGHLRTVQVSSDMIARYIDERKAEGAEAATVNRELAFLKRAFRLGAQATPPKVQRLPHFPMLKESNVRKGFLEDADYNKLAAECANEGLWLRAMLAVYYSFGWRKSEVLGLHVNQVDLASRTIRLEVGETKNSQGRTVRMTDEIFHLISACVHGKKGTDYVFTRSDGKPVRTFRAAWHKACTAAGVPELLLHDLRRTGARNLRRLGVGETTAMKVGGWKTRSVFQRYDIVSESDLADAAQRLDVKREEQAKASEFRHNSDTIEGIGVEGASGKIN